MSYCRFSAGDVYMYHDVDGTWHCCACFLLRGDKTVPKLRYAQEYDVILPTRSAAILHLRHHKLMGHHVPGYAEKRLMQELYETGEGNGKPLSYRQYRRRVEAAQVRMHKWAQRMKKKMKANKAKEKNAKRKA